MLPATVMLGNRAYDWKTIPTLRRWGALLVTSASSTVMDPELGRSKPAMMQTSSSYRSRWSQERDELALLRLEVEILDGDGTANELLADVGQVEEAHRVCRSVLQCAPVIRMRVREPRPITAITPIASQVRPKLMIATAAGR